MKRLLVIENDDQVYLAITNILRNIYFDLNCVIRCTLLNDLEKTDTDSIEIVLTSLKLPDSDSADTFDLVFRKFPVKPIIVLARANEIDDANKAVQLGALDYLLKDNLENELLNKVIQYAFRQKKVLDKINIEKQNLAAIINNTKDIIWSIDREYKIITANQPFWDRIKIITGKNDIDIHRTDFDRDLFTTWNGYFERAFSGETFKIIWNEIHFGAEIYEEVNFNPIHDTVGNIIGITCFSRDITEQRIYLKKIEKQNRQLKQIAWEQSHRVRVPVANILGLTQLLNYDNLTDPNNKYLLTHIKESADILDGVIKKIVAYTDSTND